MNPLKFKSYAISTAKPNVYMLSFTDGDEYQTLLVWNTAELRIAVKHIASNRTRNLLSTINNVLSMARIPVSVVRKGDKVIVECNYQGVDAKYSNSQGEEIVQLFREHLAEPELVETGLTSRDRPAP